MDVNELNIRLSQDLPIFLYEDKVKVIDVIEIMGLVEIEYPNGEKNMIDSLLLKGKPTECEKGIPLGLFVPYNKDDDDCKY